MTPFINNLPSFNVGRYIEPLIRLNDYRRLNSARQVVIPDNPASAGTEKRWDFSASIFVHQPRLLDVATAG